MSGTWPFSVKRVLDENEKAPGDRVLADGTRIIGRDWGWDHWTATVLPPDGCGWTQAGFRPSLTEALDAAEAKYYAMRADGYPSMEYWLRIAAEQREARDRAAAAETPEAPPVRKKRWWRW